MIRATRLAAWIWLMTTLVLGAGWFFYMLFEEGFMPSWTAIPAFLPRRPSWPFFSAWTTYHVTFLLPAFY
ncbi:MAG: hypothetical protein Q8939_00665 [Bacteroidota bacterium]|nr:hypothetical protein [Bacteroidota bacterium]MDP4212010.1 hypothetical protein [Bacteroidota bacterium]